MKVVSLIPSATEIVCALGFEETLVGRSHECDFPHSVKHLPICTAPSFNPEGTSREIDDRVKDRLKRALSIYNVFENRLKELAPDIIITQAQCDVCAVNLETVERSLEGWGGKAPKLISLVPNRLTDIWQDIESVARALGAPEVGRELVQSLEKRIQAIASRARDLATFSVGTIEWLDPLMAAGNWIPELVTLAGGRPLFGEAGKHSPWIDPDQFWRSDPDVIVIIPCGFSIARTQEELILLTRQPIWPSLKAVRNRRVFIADGNQYFNRPGPRLVESLEILAELLHPNTFSFGHQDRGWKAAGTHRE
ncbi:MAG: cobalamin-binding protein [Deltaproteobacteria bacterium]|nr:cobalamin-binding protein [Deltaproteobacteria bacterium]